ALGVRLLVRRRILRHAQDFQGLARQGHGAGGGEQGGELPVLLGPERLDLAFAVHDELQGDGLDAAGAGATGYLAAEEVAQREAAGAVEDASGLLGLDAVHVDLAGRLQGVLDGGAGDLVEGNTEGAGLVEVEHLGDVPGDGLALAVGVGGEVDGVDPVGLAFEFGDDLLGPLAATALAFDEDVGGLPTALDVNASQFLALLAFDGQVANVAVAGPHLEVATQVFLNGLGLGGRLDDYQGPAGFGPGPGWGGGPIGGRG